VGSVHSADLSACLLEMVLGLVLRTQLTRVLACWRWSWVWFCALSWLECSPVGDGSGVDSVYSADSTVCWGWPCALKQTCMLLRHYTHALMGSRLGSL